MTVINLNLGKHLFKIRKVFTKRQLEFHHINACVDSVELSRTQYDSVELSRTQYDLVRISRIFSISYLLTSLKVKAQQISGFMLMSFN